MEETTLYLVRHGETEYNRKGIVQGRLINSNLNGTGRAQAEALAEHLALVPVDAIYTSPLTRARETATAIAAYHDDVPIYVLDDLEEMSWGIHEGKPISGSFQKELHSIYRIWSDGDFSYQVEEGESILDVQARGLRALHRILANHQGETVLIVTHGRLLRVLIASVLDDYGLSRMSDITHSNTGVNRLTYYRGRFSAEVINCTDHLDGVNSVFSESDQIERLS